MNAIIWIVSIASVATFVLIAAGHCFCMIRFFVKGTNFSVVPFLGGILGGAGFFLAPNPASRHLWWLPFFLDLGSVPSLMWSILLLVKKRLQRMAHYIK
jgi:hypothetical protein